VGPRKDETRDLMDQLDGLHVGKKQTFKPGDPGNRAFLTYAESGKRLRAAAMWRMLTGL
jgi:hypothetical protein